MFKTIISCFRNKFFFFETNFPLSFALFFIFKEVPCLIVEIISCSAEFSHLQFACHKLVEGNCPPSLHLNRILGRLNLPLLVYCLKRLTVKYFFSSIILKSILSWNMELEDKKQFNRDV